MEKHTKDWIGIAIGSLALVAFIFVARPAHAADNGATMFKAKCVACHGADGSGQTVMGKKFGIKDLGSAEVQKLTDQQLFDIISKGQNKMPSYSGKITDEEIKSLVTFIRTLKK
ncbi:MAG: cytochrome c [Thermoanaerobaculia bacterium]